MTPFITRAYNSFSIESNHLIKSSKEQRLKDESDYYSNLIPELQHHFPKFDRQYKEGDTYKLKLEYLRDYNDLGTYLTGIKPQITQMNWEKILKKLLDILTEFKQYSRSSNGDHLSDMLVGKTEREYLNLKNNFPQFQSLLGKKEISINQIPYSNFEVIWDDVKQCISKFSKIDFSVIHGDFCFSNVLIKNDFSDIKLIDPRGGFGERGIYGDIRYDYAKLLHSIHGAYELIINDMFEVVDGDNFINFTYYKAKSLDNLSIILERLLGDTVNINEIKLIEGLIFIGMCARHYDSSERQFAMYATGIEILNDVINVWK